MLNWLLEIDSTIDEVGEIFLYYGCCLAILLFVSVCIVLLKLKTKKEMRIPAVRKSCVKAKNYAEKLLAEEQKKAGFLGSMRLMKLDSRVKQAAWLAFQIFEGKRDIVFKDIANTLDTLATTLADELSIIYVSGEDYQTSVQNAVEILEEMIAKLDFIALQRSRRLQRKLAKKQQAVTVVTPEALARNIDLVIDLKDEEEEVS